MIPNTIDQWRSARREPLQDFDDYREVSEAAQNSIRKITALLEDPKELATKSRAGTASGARRRAEAALELLTYGYSAGVAPSALAAQFPAAVEYWRSFAVYDLAFDTSAESDGHLVPHIDLYDRTYWEALQLVCYAILLGHPNLLGRIMALLVYENDDQDALLEALVAPYLPGRPGSTIYTRQLPYRKLRKLFDAAPDMRPALMSQYLDEWYEGSRREPYHDRHKSAYFPGYWSFEAAAVTFVYGIDDSSYRDKKFYPKDLVDYAREHSWVGPLDQGDPQQCQKAAEDRLRCEAGQPCPRAGWWATPAAGNVRQQFAQGEVMPSLGGDYGATIWHWDSGEGNA